MRASAQRYVHGAGIARLAPAALAGETITFFHNSVAGNPALAMDANGIQSWKETYRPYGDQLVDSSAAQNNKLWFTGKPFDDSTGLSYMGARYYDPTLGRFMAVDPVSFDLGNLHSFNRYANNNPYRYVDPRGESPTSIAMGYAQMQELRRTNPAEAARVEKVGLAIVATGAAIGGGVYVAAAALANPVVVTELTIAVAEAAAGDALGGATLAAGTAMVVAADDVAEGVGNLIWRGGGRNPGNLTPREGEAALSFRNSLSNPMPQAKLPSNSVIHDGGTNGLPPGHVSVTAPVERIQEAIVEKGRFPK